MAADNVDRHPPILAWTLRSAIRQRPPRRGCDRYARQFLCGGVAQLCRIAVDRGRMARSCRAALEPNIFYEPAFALESGGRVRPRAVRCCLVGHQPAQTARFLSGAHRTAALMASSCRFSLVGRMPTLPRTPLSNVKLRSRDRRVVRLPCRRQRTARPVDVAVCVRQGAFAAALDAITTRTQMPAADFDRHKPCATRSGQRPPAVCRAHARPAQTQGIAP